MNTIRSLLATLTQQLVNTSSTARLDVELLLGFVLQRNRAYILSHLEDEIPHHDMELLNNYVRRRQMGEPMAYIVGQKEFWLYSLIVTPATLVPRPETEHLVEWILATFDPDQQISIADLGTGSGAIAVALGAHSKHWKIDATDISVAALQIAQENVKNYQLTNIHFYSGDWYAALPECRKYNLIVSNPPYIAEHDAYLLELQSEPQTALVSGDEGLCALTEIITQAGNYLLPGGFIVLEHGYDQGERVVQLLKEYGFCEPKDYNDLAGVSRFVTARWR